MTAVTVACCQLAPVLGDPAANRELSADAISAAAAAGAQVIVLPELTSSGYMFASKDEARGCAEPATGPAVSGWSRLAAALNVVIVAGFAETDGATVFNSAVLVDETGLRAVYRKAHLWDAEPAWFAAGSGPPPVVATRYGRIGVLICYDLEFPEWLRLAALGGAQLVCAPVNWPAYAVPAGQSASEVIKAQAGAAVNRMFLAACDRVGPERGADWLGASLIADPRGWLLAGGSVTATPAALLAECDLDAALDKTVSPRNDVLTDRRPQLYARLAQPWPGR